MDVEELDEPLLLDVFPGGDASICTFLWHKSFELVKHQKKKRRKQYKNQSKAIQYRKHQNIHQSKINGQKELEFRTYYAYKYIYICIFYDVVSFAGILSIFSSCI